MAKGLKSDQYLEPEWSATDCRRLGTVRIWSCASSAGRRWGGLHALGDIHWEPPDMRLELPAWPVPSARGHKRNESLCKTAEVRYLPLIWESIPKTWGFFVHRRYGAVARRARLGSGKELVQ